eukprot:1326215-Amorphochlora_amoeboformis.AAC.2
MAEQQPVVVFVLGGPGSGKVWELSAERSSKNSDLTISQRGICSGVLVFGSTSLPFIYVKSMSSRAEKAKPDSPNGQLIKKCIKVSVYFLEDRRDRE